MTSLPQPPPSTTTPLPHLQHPFDTHAFVNYLEKSEVKQGTAVVLMESVRDLIIQRKTMALKRMLDKEDMENVSGFRNPHTSWEDAHQLWMPLRQKWKADSRAHTCSELHYRSFELSCLFERRAILSP